jgi:UDP-3-O-[3-hydroxymyristoyl] glucosamine N-acyltransferase
MESALSKINNEDDVYSIKEILYFLKNKGIPASFQGNHEIFISGLSHLENPEPNKIIYSENEFQLTLRNVLISNAQEGQNIINTPNPKLAFYYLSELFYRKKLISNASTSQVIDESCIVGNNTIIGQCSIGKGVTIGHNTTIEDGVSIGDNTIIGNNCSIGCFGLSWTWDGENKVFLYAIGNTNIGKDCKISSNVKIVRGIFSKSTTLGDGIFIAPGTAIGHGVTIMDGVHIANNCSIGGSAIISENCFLGCSSTVSTYALVGKNTILASSSCTKSNQILEQNSVYLGVPAKKHKNIKNNYSLKGVPRK